MTVTIPIAVIKFFIGMIIGIVVTYIVRKSK